MSEDLFFDFEIEDGIAVTRINRPPANAIIIELLDHGCEVLKRLEDDDSVKAVVLTGAGRCFSAGLDIKVIPGYDDSQQKQLVNSMNRFLGRLYGFPKPTVAAVNGHAIAGGFFPMIGCDRRVCADSGCSLGLTEARMGLKFPLGCMELLWSELSGQVNRRLVLSGQVFTPEEGLSMGIVDELRPPAEVMSRAKEAAAELGQLPQRGYGLLKRQLRQQSLASIDAVVASGVDRQLDGSLLDDKARAAAEELLQRK